MLKNISLNDVNPHIVCKLCNGYLIDPVTLVECLHSFCKTCIVKYVEKNKDCPTCDVQIHKTKPTMSMKSDKVLQNIVYKLVPNLFVNEMKRRKNHEEKYEPTKVSREELEKHFFFRDDKISMSIEYYDSTIPNGSSSDPKNLNRRYLECPGTVKVQHLKKFIIMKYALTEKFVIDIIYMGDIIPEDFTLIDVAYYYKWEKEAPMRFFYRIFKKTRVYLKRRKSRLNTEESNTTPDSEPSTKKPKVFEDPAKKNGTPSMASEGINGREQHPGIRSCNAPEEVVQPEVTTGSEKSPTSTKSPPSPEQSIQVTSKSTCLVLRIDKQNPAYSTCMNKSPTTIENREPDQTVEKEKKLDKEGDTRPEVKPSKQPELRVLESRTTENKKPDENMESDSNPDPKKKLEIVPMEVDEVKLPSPKPQTTPPDKMRILSITSIIKPNNPVPESKKENSAPPDSPLVVTTLPPAPTPTPTPAAPPPPPSPLPTSTPSQQPPRNIISEIAEAREARTQSNSGSSVTPMPAVVTPTQKPLSPSQGKPKLNKMSNGSQILSVINNLTKKQLNLEASLHKDSKLNGDSPPPPRKPIQEAPISMVSKATTSSSNTTPTTTSSSSSSSSSSHHIPSGTTLTMKQIFSPISMSSPTPSSILTPTNGTSVVVSASSIKNAHASPKSLLSNVMILSPTEKSKQTLNDLRQFRKPSLDMSPVKTSPTSATQLTLSNKPKQLTPNMISSLMSHAPTGSHKLPGNISAAGGLAAMKPINLSTVRPTSTMSLSDHQRALQFLKSTTSTTSSGLSTHPIFSTGKPSNPTASSGSPQQAQLPSSRLQLKVQQAPPMSPFQAAFQSTIYNQLAVESLWKQQQSAAAAAVMQANMNALASSNGKAFGGLSKTPNQGIRQIPNPSLFAKQQQDFIMAMAAAAAIRSGGDPRPNGERK